MNRPVWLRRNHWQIAHTKPNTDWDARRIIDFWTPWFCLTVQFSRHSAWGTR